MNETAHFPQTLQELENWGNTPDPTYGQRRRQPNGVWTPIMQGPTPGKTDLERGGFPHQITNEVGNVERLLNVDPSGNIWGGSWDPAYNAAHPELRGSGFQTAQAGLAQTAVPPRPGAVRGAQEATFTAQSRSMDQNNYVAQEGTQWVSVVDGVKIPWNSQAAAEQNYNQRTGSDTGQPAAQPAQPAQPAAQPSAEPGATSPGSAGTTGAPAGGGGGGQGIIPSQVTEAISAADRAFQNAYLAKRLELDRDVETHRDENEKKRLAMEAGRDAWTKTYQTGTLSGYVPGTGTAGKGQAVMDALQTLRGNAQYQAADGAGRRQMEAATVAQTTGIDLASAGQAIDRLRALTAATGQPSSAALVESVLGQTPGGAGTPSLDRDIATNKNAIDALTLLSNLRGPENAFAYANTLANLPPSIRANIQTAMGKLPFTAQNPAQQGLLNDVGATMGGQPGQPGQPAGQPGQPGQPAPDFTISRPGTMSYDNTGPPVAGQPAPNFTETYTPGPNDWFNNLARRGQPGLLPDGAWSDASRGNPQPGMSYAQVITPAGGDVRSPAPAWSPIGTTSPFAAATGDQLAQYRALMGGIAGSPAVGAQGTLGGVSGMPGPAPGPLVVLPDGRIGHRPPGWQSPGAATASGALGQPLPPAYGPRTGALPLPQHISPTDWNNTAAYAKKVLLGGYENAGQDPSAVLDQYTRSLPTAYGPRSGRLRVA